MKKYLFIPTLFLLLAACSSDNDIESRAKAQMKLTMEELAKNPETLQITKVSTEYKEDSLCILHFIAKGQNGFGGYSAGKFEYVYKIYPDKAKEYLNDLEKDESIIQKARELSLKNKDNPLLESDTFNIQSLCLLHLALKGRNIEAEH